MPFLLLVEYLLYYPIYYRYLQIIYNQNENDMENPSIKYGVYVGVIGIVLGLATYILGTAAFFHWSKGIVGLLILIWGMVMAGNAFRDSNNGFASWKEILKPTFIVGIISGVFSTIFQFLMFNVIDPGLANAQKDSVIASMEGFADIIGEEGMEDLMDNLDAQTFDFGPVQAILTIGTFIIGAFIIAAIVSAILKRNRPHQDVV